MFWGGGGVPVACIIFMCCFSVASLGNLAVSASFVHYACALTHVPEAFLGSAFGVLARVCFLVFPLPPVPIQGSRALYSIVSFIELTVQCNGCLIWGLGWRPGLWLGGGQAYGVFHRPGFGLLLQSPDP